jgi:hypothetical protein
MTSVSTPPYWVEFKLVPELGSPIHNYGYLLRVLHEFILDYLKSSTAQLNLDEITDIIRILLRPIHRYHRACAMLIDETFQAHFILDSLHMNIEPEPEDDESVHVHSLARAEAYMNVGVSEWYRYFILADVPTDCANIVLDQDELDGLDTEMVTDCETDPCSICVEPYTTGQMTTLLPVCRHRFHEECIQQWLGQYAPTCPMCRRNVRLKS